MAIGLLSAGIGRVPPAQTFLDTSQGNRVPPVLYDVDLPPLPIRSAGIPRVAWRQLERRAQGVPADIVPGLFANALRVAGLPVGVLAAAGAGALIGADEAGRIDGSGAARCRRCPGVEVRAAGLAWVRQAARRTRGHDLLIALERPPPPSDRELSLGIAGIGFDGTLTSDSTRMRGYVLSTDLAPTILTRLGLGVPDEMTGQTIRASGETDPAYLSGLEDRLAVIGPRRGPVIATNLLIWVGLAALAGVALGARGLRLSLPLLAVSLAWLPAVLLVTAALEPSELVERLIAGAGAPALAVLTLRLAPAFGALAIAGGASVAGYAVDVIAGSSLTELSLMGPNPAFGVRFYGIGNEIEATVAALVPIATGAAFAAWAPPWIAVRRAALGFALTAIGAVAAFAPGRFGADVGAAIGIPIGAAIAIAACLGGGGRRAALVIAAPLAALAALALADLVLGADAHLTRSVLHAGGLDDLAQVAERRLRLSAHSFGHYAGTAVLWIAVAAILAGIAGRRRVQSWFGPRRIAWAGFAGAAGATAAGTLANDSGALVLMIGTALCAATAGLAWATRPRPAARSRPSGGLLLR